MANILVVDDEERLLKIIAIALREEGHAVVTATDGKAAQEAFSREAFHCIVTDLRMPNMGGMELLKWVRDESPFIPVIIMTAYGSIETAIEAMRAGASNYLLKPCNLDELKLQVEQVLKQQKLIWENQYLKDKSASFERIIGESQAMKNVFSLVDKLARTDSIALILGESGTGKELVAKAIHNRSPRKDRTLVSINCNAIPSELLESELFGHVKGAFTGAHSNKIGKFVLADKSTIFLDEIGDMAPTLQGKLLRVLQEKVIEPVGSVSPRKVDVRIIAATNKDLEALVKEQKFREDLYFRLNVVPITLPPLRERPEDIPLLINHFLGVKNAGGESLKVSPDVMTRLMHYKWPGNVRELENLVERALVLGSTEVFRQLNLPPAPRMIELPSKPTELPYKEAKAEILKKFEIDYFKSALRKTNGNVSKAADSIGMHRKNLIQKLQALNIDPKFPENNNG